LHIARQIRAAMLQRLDVIDDETWNKDQQSYLLQGRDVPLGNAAAQ